MPKTFRVSITGGIDAVTDIGMGDGRHVAYMENLDVRGGKAKPFNLPRVNANVVVPAGSTQVYAYRSRILFSDKRRDYAAEYVDSRERIYWTEYGGNPEKMVEGTVVPLGTTTPDVPPSASIGTYVAPNNIVVTVASGGTLATDVPTCLPDRLRGASPQRHHQANHLRRRFQDHVVVVQPDDGQPCHADPGVHRERGWG
jgi:hypothetical protein